VKKDQQTIVFLGQPTGPKIQQVSFRSQLMSNVPVFQVNQLHNQIRKKKIVMVIIFRIFMTPRRFLSQQISNGKKNYFHLRKSQINTKENPSQKINDSEINIGIKLKKSYTKLLHSLDPRSLQKLLKTDILIRLKLILHFLVISVLASQMSSHKQS
jgi:hypothetical protein